MKRKAVQIGALPLKTGRLCRELQTYTMGTTIANLMKYPRKNNCYKQTAKRKVPDDKDEPAPKKMKLVDGNAAIMSLYKAVPRLKTPKAPKLQRPKNRKTPVTSTTKRVASSVCVLCELQPHEEMLKDVSHSNEKWNIIALRYFNPVGAHPSGLIGEDPTKQFTNLMPFISQVASGKKPSLTIFGNDYETPDGTGIRDYIHVMDLATGHVAALAKLEKQHLNIKMFNLGIGKGVSVLELVTTFEQINNVKVPYQVEPRRAGDISEMYADPSLAEKELNWKAVRSIQEMCSDFWKWQQMNPDGYKTIITNGHHK